MATYAFSNYNTQSIQVVINGSITRYIKKGYIKFEIFGDEVEIFHHDAERTRSRNHRRYNYNDVTSPVVASAAALQAALQAMIDPVPGATPDLATVTAAGNDAGGTAILNIGTSTVGTSAATVAQATKFQTLGMTQGVIANTGLGETKLWSLLIPAGTIGNNDMLETFIANSRTAGSGNVQGRIYINTADTLVGAQLINTTFTGSATMVSSTGYRKWLNSSTSTIGMATNATGPTITVGGTRLPLTINNAVDQYVIAAINQTVGTDTTNLEWVSVRLYKYP